MRNTLYRNYLKKKFAYGGPTDDTATVDDATLGDKRLLANAGVGPTASAAAPPNPITQSKPSTPDYGKFSKTAGAIAGFGTSAIDAIDPGNDHGRQSVGSSIGKGALSGAAMGSTLGPWGAAAGAVIGGAVGWIGGAAAKSKEDAIISAENTRKHLSEIQTNNAQLASDPTQITGRQNAQYFKAGGLIKMATGGTTTAKPVQDYSEWGSVAPQVKEEGWYRHMTSPDGTTTYANDYPATGHGVMLDGKPNGQVYMTGKGGKFNVIIRDNTGAKQDFPILQGVDAATAHNYFTQKPGTINQRVGDLISTAKMATGGLIHPNPSIMAQPLGTLKKGGYLTHKALGGDMDGDEAPLSAQESQGGTAQSLSSDNTQIQGPSHEQGGVQFPQSGAELEGGETTKDNFVFSKELGFAALHKPLAKAKGLIEKKPLTMERKNSLDLLDKREKRLALSQEMFKKMHGIS